MGAAVTDTVAIPRLKLEDPAGELFFEPHPTISALELAQCTSLFLRMTMWKAEWGEPPWRAYVAAHGLERHFVAI